MPSAIVPGLHRLPGVVGVNSFLWQPDAGAHREGAPMLFDCGWPWSGRALTASLMALDVPPESLETIAITHDDMDHVGRLAALHAVSGALVIAGAREAARLSGAGWRVLPPPRLPLAWAVHAVEACLRRSPRAGVRVGLQVEDGARLPGGWLAIHTPGHTPGHTSYFQPEQGVLIAGDALGTTLGGRLRVPMSLYCEEPGEAVRSIRKLAQLEPRVICAGHGPALFDAAGLLRQFAACLPGA